MQSPRYPSSRRGYSTKTAAIGAVSCSTRRKISIVTNRIAYLAEGHVPVLLKKVQHLISRPSNIPSKYELRMQPRGKDKAREPRTLLISPMFSMSSGLASAGSAETATAPAFASKETGGTESPSPADVMPRRRCRRSGQALAAEGRRRLWWQWGRESRELGVSGTARRW
jgi:hypothetical protein